MTTTGSFSMIDKMEFEQIFNRCLDTFRHLGIAEVMGSKSHPVHFLLRGNYSIELSLVLKVVGQNLLASH
jgi:hypothetical protein